MAAMFAAVSATVKDRIWAFACIAATLRAAMPDSAKVAFEGSLPGAATAAPYCAAVNAKIPVPATAIPPSFVFASKALKFAAMAAAVSVTENDFTRALDCAAAAPAAVAPVTVRAALAGNFPNTVA